MKRLLVIAIVASSAVVAAQQPKVESHELRSETRGLDPDAGNPDALPPLADDGETLLVPPIHWEPGTVRWTPDSETALDQVRRYLDATPAVTVLRIEVHGDGSGEQSTHLGKWRAGAIARWLATKGIDCARLLPVAFGDDRPLVRTDSPEARAKNERVVFMVAERRGRPVRGRPVDGGGDETTGFCP